MYSCSLIVATVQTSSDIIKCTTHITGQLVAGNTTSSELLIYLKSVRKLLFIYCIALNLWWQTLANYHYITKHNPPLFNKIILVKHYSYLAVGDSPGNSMLMLNHFLHVSKAGEIHGKMLVLNNYRWVLGWVFKCHYLSQNEQTIE